MVEIKQETKNKVEQKLNEVKTWCQKHKNVVVAAGIIVGGQCIKHALRAGRKDEKIRECDDVYVNQPIFDILNSADSISYMVPTNRLSITSDSDTVITGVIIGFKENN